MKRLAALCITAVVVVWCGPRAHAQGVVQWPDPRPFRGDEIDGRDFDYKEDGFLQRFSYAFHVQRDASWLRDPWGLRATIGSVSSDELYVFEQIRTEVEIRGPLYFEYRHLRTEDLDTRFGSNLTGLGVRLGEHWSVVALSEIVATKSDIDIQLETRWRDARANEFRFAIVAVDAPRGKSSEFDYERRPLTVFTEARANITEELRVHGWVNANPDLRREQKLENFDFTYRQYSCGLTLTYAVPDRFLARVGLEGVTTRRARRDMAGIDPTLEQRMSRRYWTSDFEVFYQLEETRAIRAGIRYLHLRERDRRLHAPTETRHSHRREWIASLGMDFHLREWLLFWPTLYIGLTDNAEGFPDDPARRVDEDSSVLSKLNLPIGIAWKDVTLDLNATVLIHEGRFGGGNVQVQIPF